MDKKRTYPNLIWVMVVLLASALVVWLTGMMVYAALIDSLDGDGIDLDGGAIATLIFLVLVFLYMAYLMLEGVTLYACYVVFDNEGIRIVRPLRFHKAHYTWGAIKGYSKSEYVISYRNHAPSSGSDALYTSSSIIIYTLDDEAYEIVKLYNWGFDDMEPELKIKGVKYLGYESFKRNWLFRQYRFLEKGVRSNYGD